MNRPVRSLAGALALLLCACVPTPSRSAPVPQDAPGRAAAALRAECARQRAKAMECYSEGLLTTMRAEGVRPAMATLERLGEADPAVKRDGHMYAHSLGLAAYSSPTEVGRTFRECEPTFQSGCYHGVIQAYFVDLSRQGAEVGPAEVNAVCADYRQSADDRWILFQCTHGIGHGLTMLRGHDLPRALEGCDLVRDAWEREGCYGGAFMESIMQATAPHHTVGRPQAQAAGGAHDHHAMHGGHGAASTPAPKFKPLDRADPLYPCSVLPERYLPSCYSMQTSVILSYNGADFAGAARTCDRVREGVLRVACYTSLGRDASGTTVQNGEKARRLCALGDPDYRSWCHVGFVKNVVDVQADTRDALAYCRALADAGAKQACYRAVGEEAWALAGSDEARERFCAPAEDAYRDECRRAAGIRMAPKAAEGTG